MSDDPPTRPGTYRIAITGLLGPALRSALAEVDSARTSTATVFVLRLAAGHGPAELAEMLQARGLMLLQVRRVTAGAGPG